MLEQLSSNVCSHYDDRTGAFSEIVFSIFKGASSHQSNIRLDGAQRVSLQSLTEVSAQSGWTVVHPELDKGVQEVPVQISELFPWTNLFQVVRSNHQQVTEGVECVKELQYQRNLKTEKQDVYTLN